MIISISVKRFFDVNKTRIEEILADHTTYCAEPHQLNEDDLISETDFEEVIVEIEAEFNATILNDDRTEMIGLLEDTLLEWYATDPTMFYI